MLILETANQVKQRETINALNETLGPTPLIGDQLNAYLECQMQCAWEEHKLK